MKKRIISVALSLLMVLAAFSTMIVGATDVRDTEFDSSELEAKLAEMEPKIENDSFELYVKEATGEMAIKNKETGEITLTNPIVTDPSQNKYLAQIQLEFKTIASGSTTKYNSYEQYFIFAPEDAFTVAEDGSKITVLYHISPAREYIVPVKISVEKMEALLERFDTEAEKSNFLRYYQLFDPESNPSKAEQMIKKYPICQETPIYAIKDYRDSNRKRIEDLLAGRYSEDEYRADYEEVREDTDEFQVEVPSFDLSVDYALANDGLTVSFDASTLNYDEEKYAVTSIDILPYFNSARTTDSGYIFLPDGSGALVRFEDLQADPTLRATLRNYLYGDDYSKYDVIYKNTEQWTMPVFGLVNNTVYDSTGFFAIIEDGEAMASIGSSCDAFCNSAFASFIITPSDTYKLTGGIGSTGSETTSYGEAKYEGPCSVKYALLTGEDASYVNMADYYRSYLTAKGDISRLEDVDPDNTEIFFEVFGSIKVDEQILTLPVKKNKPLTTFKDVMEIHDELSDAGIGNMNFILKGFTNGGLNSYYPTKLEFVKALGGKGGYSELMAYAEMNSVEITLDVEFNYSLSTANFSGLKYKKHALKTVDNRFSTKRLYYAATQTFERTGGVAISSASFEYVYDKFYSSASKYDIQSIAARSLGSDLNSDFNDDNFQTREASKENVVRLLEEMREDEYDLVLNVGNSYAIKYARAILSASLDSSRMNKASSSVPFFGMVYHASVVFTGDALNMEGDSEYMLLKAIENGASLYFTFAKQNIELLKFDPVYNKYYSVSYDILKQNIIDTYNSYNEVMKDLQDQYIVDHEILNSITGYEVKRLDGTSSDNELVVMVEYENGTSFILNYNTYDVTIEGVEETIPALSYVCYSASAEN